MGSISATPASVAEDIASLGREPKSWSSLGHPKSSGVHLTFFYPETWRAMEGARPNILQKFTGGPNLGATCVAMIQVVALPSQLNHDLSAVEKSEMLSEENAKHLLPGRATAVSYERTKIDGEDCAMLEYGFDFERAGIKGKGVGILAVIPWRGKLITVTISAGWPIDANKPLPGAAAYNKIKPLFVAMLSRLVISEKWENQDREEPSSPASPTPTDADDSWGENDPVIGETHSPKADSAAGPTVIAGVSLKLPQSLTNFTKESLADEGVGSLVKYTAIAGTRSVLIKRFDFVPTAFISPKEGARMTSADLATNPGYKGEVVPTNVAGMPAFRLNTEWRAGTDKAEQDIVFFGKGNTTWEVHVFGVNDTDRDSLRQLKESIFSSIAFDR